MHFNNINIAAIYKCSTVPFPQQIFFFFSVTFSRHHVFCSTECRSYFWPVLCSYHGNQHIIIVCCHATFVWRTKAGRLNKLPQQFRSKTAILSRSTRTNQHTGNWEPRILSHASCFQHKEKDFCNQQTVCTTKSMKVLQRCHIACF